MTPVQIYRKRPMLMQTARIFLSVQGLYIPALLRLQPQSTKQPCMGFRALGLVADCTTEE